MDGRRLDDLARALATGVSRRRALLGAVGLGVAGVGAAIRAGIGADARQAVCLDEGEACTLMVRCCEGLTCVRMPMNPNIGICTAGVEAPQVPENISSNDGTGQDEPTPTPSPTAGTTATATTTSGTTPTTTTTTSSTSNTTPTATPTEEARRRSIRVEANCEGSPDKVRIENRGDVAITVDSITARYRASSDKDARTVDVAQTIEGNRAETFEFGRGSGRDGFNQELFSDDESGSIEIETSVGSFRVSCEDTAPPEPLPLAVTLDCKGDLESTRIKNVGDTDLKIKKIGSLVDPIRDQEPFKRDDLLRPGDFITYYSGPKAKPTPLPDEPPTLLQEKIYGGERNEGARIETAAGVFLAYCDGRLERGE